MSRETAAIAANFDLIEKSLRTSLGAATAVVVGQQARANAGSEFKGAASNPCQCFDCFDRREEEAELKAHLEARDNYLDHISGCDD